MTDRPYNAGNRKDIRSAEKSQIMFSTITREVIAGVMSLPNGRHWMYEFLADAQAFADPFTPDPHTHAYLTGRKSLGVKLFNDIMLYAPQFFDVMIREANERSATESARRSVADSGPELDPFTEPERDAAEPVA